MLKNSCILNKKLALTLLLSFIAVAIVFPTVKGAEITSATPNEETYLGGQTGYISVSIYNDKNTNISVTELSATLDYYYTDGTVYVQKFFTSDDLEGEIEPGQTGTYDVPISLPTNVAPGYVDLMVLARTQLWIEEAEVWVSSDSPSEHVKLFVESPYKQSYEEAQEELQESQEELENSQALLGEQEIANRNLGVTAIGLGVIMAILGAIVAVLMIILRRPRPIAEPQ